MTKELCFEKGMLEWKLDTTQHTNVHIQKCLYITNTYTQHTRTEPLLADVIYQMHYIKDTFFFNLVQMISYIRKHAFSRFRDRTDYNNYHYSLFMNLFK